MNPLIQHNRVQLGFAVALIVAAFLIGKSYGKSHAAAARAGSAATAGQFAGRGASGAFTRGGAGASSGSVISVSGNTMTMTLQNGGSQIVILGTSTPILKSTMGTKTDLATGAMVTVTGTTNGDGSLTAQSIQIRPAGMQSFSGRGQGQGAQTVPTQ